MTLFEIFSSILIVVIAISFVLVDSLTMPMTITSLLVVALFLAFLVFAAFLWKGKPLDEREFVHSLTAARVSYLVGVGILVIGVIVQAIMHNIDIWLILTLSMMVTTRIIYLIYIRKKM